MFELPPWNEWWSALRWVALAFTCVVALTLAGSFVDYETVVHSGHPWLPAQHCSGCMLCGMTRSFCAMSDGHLDAAIAWNRGGPVLYLVGWLWLATVTVTLMLSSKTRARSCKNRKAASQLSTTR